MLGCGMFVLDKMCYFSIKRDLLTGVEFVLSNVVPATREQNKLYIGMHAC